MKTSGSPDLQLQTLQTLFEFARMHPIPHQWYEEDTMGEKYSRDRANISRNQDVVDKLLAEMTRTMYEKYQSAPIGEWQEREGNAMTPAGVFPSINLHRFFTENMEVVFHAASGVFDVLKDANKVEEFWSRY